MADYSLKDEKRINVNGEWDKVTTHPNNEPIFRQNGHELVFEAANKDDLIVENNTSWTTWSDVNWEITTDVSGVVSLNNILSFGDTVGDKFRLTRWSNGAFRGQLTIGSVTNDIQASWESSWEVITIKQENGIIYINDVAKLDFSARNADSLFSFNDFHFGRLSYTPIWYSSQTLYNVVINNETFNPIDIDSAGQIEGSNGTVATFSTSHASGLSYILDTVFQKSSFALEFDSGYSEHLSLSETVVNGDKLTFELTFNGGTGDNQYIFSGGGSFRSYFVNGVGQLTQAGCTLDKLYINGVDSPLNTDLQQNYGAKLRLEYTVTGSFSLNYICSFSDSAWFSNVDLFNYSINGTNYPLTEGLGNTTNGATINTSHADGIKRINFGMWQKNGYVLEFDAANSDYLSIDNPSFATFGDVDITVNVQNFQPKAIFSAVFSYEVTTSDSIVCSLRDNSTVYFSFVKGGSVIFNNIVALGITFDEIREVKLQNGVLSINGVTKIDESANNSETINNPSSMKLLIGGRFSSAIYYSNFDLFSFELMGKTFLLREGSGNTTTSEDGTATATINTSHASGADILWKESRQKWIDYKI